MDKWQHKAFRIIRVRPYSCENGCIVYVDVPDGIWNAAELDGPEDLSSGLDCHWEEILDRCQLVRGSIYPVIVLSADGRKLLRIRGLKGELILPEGVEEVADHAASIEDDNEISRIVWNGSIRRIGEAAFRETVATSVVLPPTVESVGRMPFLGNYIVSSRCHCDDTVSMNPYATFHLCRYKNYRRFLDDMAWIEHDCSCCVSEEKFAMDVHGLLENFDGDVAVLDFVRERSAVMAFLSSYWRLRRLKEVDGALLEVLCTQGKHVDDMVEVDGSESGFSLREKYFMLVLEDETASRERKVELVRRTMTGCYGSLERAFPLYPLHFFREDSGYRYPDVDEKAGTGLRGRTLWSRLARYPELIDAIEKDAASRFMMLLALSGGSVKKTMMSALFVTKAFSCIATLYAHYPKTEKKFPLNDLVLAALLHWPFADIMNLIEALEREMPGRISKVKDELGYNALWYLMMKKEEGPHYLPDGRYRFGIGCENAAKRLVELGMDPFETTPTGLSWYEIAIGEDDVQNKVVMAPRFVFLSMLKKRAIDMRESEGAL